jgi:uncharacterized membrane protein HdeD (DUF308 family)
MTTHEERTPMLRMLRISGILLILGLVVEALSLCWNTAFSFMSFVVVGGFLLASGVLLFLYSLVSSQRQ